ncbi:MAG TPA: GAF domain-containing protein [Terriglobales bacterium]|jgi:putative methionine-R-sulfoxide reductase with GAF domain
MNRFSIRSRQEEPDPLPVPLVDRESDVALPVPQETLRFPKGDESKTLAEIAQRDLNDALQLLVERAKYITGASGAAIALRDRDHMVCRASSGSSAPMKGANLQINSGLSGESIRTREILRCDDAEKDPRVNRESCRAMGIASVVVLPLIDGDEVNGVFELFSTRPCAFEERDIATLQRLAELIQTAVEHAEATRRVELDFMAVSDVETAHQIESSSTEQEPAKKEEHLTTTPAGELKQTTTPAQEKPPLPEVVVATEYNLSTQNAANRASAENVPPQEQEKEPQVPELQAEIETHAAKPEQVPSTPSSRGNIGACQACGFPVSEGRTFCVDCDASEQGRSNPNSEVTPAFLSSIAEGRDSLSSTKYLIGIVIVVIATVLLLLRFH